jgi:hypothetical protein
MFYWQNDRRWQDLTDARFVRRGKRTQPSLASPPRGAFELWG